jgi:hypothetical protein
MYPFNAPAPLEGILLPLISLLYKYEIIGKVENLPKTNAVDNPGAKIHLPLPSPSFKLPVGKYESIRNPNAPGFLE